MILPDSWNKNLKNERARAIGIAIRGVEVCGSSKHVLLFPLPVLPHTPIFSLGPITNEMSLRTGSSYHHIRSSQNTHVKSTHLRSISTGQIFNNDRSITSRPVGRRFLPFFVILFFDFKLKVCRLLAVFDRRYEPVTYIRLHAQHCSWTSQQQRIAWRPTKRIQWKTLTPLISFFQIKLSNWSLTSIADRQPYCTSIHRLVFESKERSEDSDQSANEVGIVVKDAVDLPQVPEATSALCQPLS